MDMELSSYLVAPLIAWALAQTLKYLLEARRAGSLSDLSQFYKSGNMPSSHSALMVSLLTVIGIKDGTDSALFATVAVLSLIVIYDAINVRRAVGEQGLVVLELAKKAGVKQPFHQAMGHRITEVTAGAVLGLLTGVLVLQFM